MILKMSTELSQTCPTCKTLIRKNIIQYYEADSPYEQLKTVSDVFDRFSVTCPKCGFEAALSYPFRYVDRLKKLDLFLIPIGHPLEDELLNDLINCDENHGFITRLVSDKTELADKINVFNAGLDDKAVELCKIFMWGDLCEQQPKYSGSKILGATYVKREVDNTAFSGANVIMFSYEQNGKRDSISLVMEPSYYKNIKTQCQQDIDAQPKQIFDEINRNWGFKVIDYRRARLGLA